jgi:hypothetical protein
MSLLVDYYYLFDHLFYQNHYLTHVKTFQNIIIIILTEWIIIIIILTNFFSSNISISFLNLIGFGLVIVGLNLKEIFSVSIFKFID